MKWFRSQIKHGSRLALLALAIQFGLSFGHFHGIATAQAAPTLQSSVASSDIADRQQPTSNHDSDQHPNDACAICAVIALANTMQSATPPLLLVPQATEFFYRVSDAEFADLNSARVVFQPRAPPLS
jgi:Protein of unknown function (DUF2946)